MVCGGVVGVWGCGVVWTGVRALQSKVERGRGGVVVVVWWAVVGWGGGVVGGVAGGVVGGGWWGWWWGWGCVDIACPLNNCLE